MVAISYTQGQGKRCCSRIAISLNENLASSTKAVKLEGDAFRENDLLVLTSSAASSFFKTKPSRGDVLWREAFNKIADKMVWEGKNNKYDPIEGDLKTRVVCIEEKLFPDENPSFAIKNPFEELRSNVIVLVGLNEESTLTENWKFLKDNIFDKANAITAFNCSTTVAQYEKYGDFYPYENSPYEPLLKTFDELLNTKRNTDRKRYEIAMDLWQRKSLDDLVFLMFVLIDTYGAYPIKSVQSVTSTESTSFEQLSCMCGNCADAMAECFKDETCRKALDCLNKCKGNDQVCSYRCITSHETPAFERFAMCILQKHNCMGNHATVPVYPNPLPMIRFRNEELSFETAENIFIGHLQLREGESNPLSSNEKLLPWSWKVVCGQNPAYDYFACQHQLFYRDKARPSVVWYDPVFRVTTLYGEVCFLQTLFK